MDFVRSRLDFGSDKQFQFGRRRQASKCATLPYLLLNHSSLFSRRGPKKGFVLLPITLLARSSCNESTGYNFDLPQCVKKVKIERFYGAIEPTNFHSYYIVPKRLERFCITQSFLLFTNLR